jgi:hypothetical protein
MTFEKKCTIDPQDIIAIDLECRNCGASSFIPMERLNPSDVAKFAERDCTFCRTPNGFSPDTAELETLRIFLEMTVAMGKTMRGRNLKLKLGIRFSEQG